MKNTQEQKQGNVFTKPVDESDLRDYNTDTECLSDLRLQRISEDEAVGMTYVGSLDEIIEWEDTEARWNYPGRSELSCAFSKRLEFLRNRPTPTHYFLDVRLEEKHGNYFRRYRAFANFYRDIKADGEKIK